MERSNRIKELRDAAGLSQASLGKAVGTSGEQIRKLESGERRLTLDWMARLAKGLKCELAELLAEQPAREAVASPEELNQSPPSQVTRVAEKQFVDDPRNMVPIRSAGRGGNGQEMFLGDGPMGYTRRPTVLETVRDAYAIYMTGDSMEPRYFSSYMLYVHPFKPPRPGRAVVVTLNSNEVLVKLFVRQDSTMLHLRQLNPDKELSIPQHEVRDVHLIVGSAEE